MKTENEDGFEEIGDLLRSSRGPAARPSPGLEGRILRRLESERRTKAGWKWSWLVLPAAGLAAMVVLLSNPQGAASGQKTLKPERAVKVTLPEIAPGRALAAAGIYDRNPLRDETLALQRDANRAEDFLFECLPSMGHVD